MGRGVRTACPPNKPALTGGPFFLVLAEAYRFLSVVEFHTFEPSVFMFQSRSMLSGLLYVLQALVGVSVLR